MNNEEDLSQNADTINSQRQQRKQTLVRFTQKLYSIIVEESVFTLIYSLRFTVHSRVKVFFVNSTTCASHTEELRVCFSLIPNVQHFTE